MEVLGFVEEKVMVEIHCHWVVAALYLVGLFAKEVWLLAEAVWMLAKEGLLLAEERLPLAEEVWSFAKERCVYVGVVEQKLTFRV